MDESGCVGDVRARATAQRFGFWGGSITTRQGAGHRLGRLILTRSPGLTAGSIHALFVCVARL